MSAFFRDFLFLLGPHRRRASIVLVLLVGASLLDLCGIGLVWPYIVVLSQPELLEGEPAWQGLKSFVGIESDQSAGLLLGASIVLIFCSKGFVHFRMHRYILRFGAQHYVYTVGRLTRLYERTPYEFFIGRASSMLVRQTYNAQLFANQGLIPALRIFAELIVAIAVISLLAVINTVAVAILAGILALLLLVYDRRYRRRSRALGEARTQALTQMMAEVTHVSNTLKELRIFGTEQYFFARLRRQAEVIGQTSSEHAIIAQLPRYVVDSAMVTFVVLMASVSTLLPGGTEAIVATLGVFGAAAARLIPSINQLATNSNELRFSRGPTEALRKEIMNLTAMDTGRSSVEATNEIGAFRSLELDGVGFTYGGTSNPALRGVGLTINAGDSVGVIGTSGAGKTTLIDVLVGLLAPQQGTIRVNGEPLQHHQRAWRDMVAYLPQDVQLVDGSVRANVALGTPDEEIDDAKVWRALDMARLRDYVESLPGGLDAVVGEHGERLSGGQGARVALARAFFFERQVFVLDEATASLDHETEAEIVSEIQQLKGNKTVVVIAHRLSTVEHCDVLYRLESGQVVASGSYASVVPTRSAASQRGGDPADGNLKRSGTTEG